MGGRHAGERRYICPAREEALKRKSPSIQYIVVDVTESPINRRKEGQKAYYSGKKRHTLKTQVIIG
jgi:hypothetical protein